ncbi:hypothetical protein QEN19_000055 [Hanseniaspora menglaensis]
MTEEFDSSLSKEKINIIPKKKRKLKLVEVEIVTPVVHEETKESIQRKQLNKINDKISETYNHASERVKKRKLIDPTEYKLQLQERRTKKIKELMSIESSQCHFCFNNPNIADHMLISIAENSYLTLAKGPVSVAQNGLKFPGHVIITPIEHKAKLSSFASQDNQQDKITDSKLFNELILYQHSIAKMFVKNDMGTVFFDFNTIHGVHYHIQCVPVPTKFLQKVGIAIDRQLKYHESKFGADVLSPFKKFISETDEDYLSILNNKDLNFIQFKIMNSRGKCEILVSTFDPEKRIDMQFGRSVLAYVLNQPKRHFWNNPECQETVEQEQSHVEKFQVAYNDFDITNE